MKFSELFEHVYSGEVESDVKIESLTEPDRTAFKVYRVLSGRKGFDHWWENIETDIQDEIFEEVKKAIYK